MQLNRFDLNLLIALDALLHEKNVTRAAERVHVSQPAMSAALQKLREYFGDPLLVRVGRELELTPRGLSLVEPVREALLRIQATLGTQPSFDPARVRRSFTLIVSPDALLRILPAVLRRVSREAPGIQCLIEPFSETALARLEYGDADLYVGLHSLRLFGLRAVPESLRSATLRTIGWLCALDCRHPTAGETLSREQYLALPHLVAWPRGPTLTPEELLRRLLEVDVQVQVATHDLLELPWLLAGTSLIATVPDRAAPMLGSSGALRTLPLPFTAPEVRETVIWHKRNEPDPGHAWLRELIIEAGRDA